MLEYGFSERHKSSVKSNCKRNSNWGKHTILYTQIDTCVHTHQTARASYTSRRSDSLALLMQIMISIELNVRLVCGHALRSLCAVAQVTVEKGERMRLDLMRDFDHLGFFFLVGGRLGLPPAKLLLLQSGLLHWRRRRLRHPG